MVRNTLPCCCPDQGRSEFIYAVLYLAVIITAFTLAVC